MLMRLCRTIVSVALLVLMPAACGVARAQFGGFGFPTAGYGSGYGAAVSGGYGGYGGAVASSYGYGVRTGQVGSGYQSAGGLYPQVSYPRVNYPQGGYSTRPQTTYSLGPLYSAITSVPGWYGPSTTHRVRRRLHTTRPSAPRTPPFNHDGKILWPSTVPDDPAARDLRRAAESAVLGVVGESNSTGHASIRPVIDAKKKLSAFERKVLPEVQARNVTDGAALETFFFDLDNALDTMTYTY
jgi:hypothetical protein